MHSYSLSFKDIIFQSKLKKFSSKVEIFEDVEADPSLKTLLNSIEVGKKMNATGVIGDVNIWALIDTSQTPNWVAISAP